LAWPQDAAWWNACEFVGTVVVGGERVTIRSAWAAHNPALIVTGTTSGILPWLVVGHWAFDAEEPLIVVGDDKEKGRTDVECGHVSNDFQMRGGHGISSSGV
jgi:hypothetical protein